MEMASGGEMYDRVVAKGRYSEAEARQALRMLLNGLSYLHSIRVTHRDLKPENLLYSDTTPDARLLITDFGLAYQAETSQEKMTETCGTPEYIAPEVTSVKFCLINFFTPKISYLCIYVRKFEKYINFFEGGGQTSKIGFKAKLRYSDCLSLSEFFS